MQGTTRGKTGWAPYDRVTISKVRKCGDIKFDIDNPADPSFPTTLGKDYQTGSLLARTLKALLLGYFKAVNDLPVQPVYVIKRLDTAQKQQALSTKIGMGVGNVKNALLGTLNGQFDWKQMRDSSVDARYSQKCGIYIIVHANFHNDPKREPEIYTGSTLRTFEARMNEHWGSDGWNQPNPASPHYRAAKKAKDHYAFPICYLPTSTDTAELKLAEQVFIDLLQTTTKSVLAINNYTETNDDTDAATTSARREMASTEAEARALRFSDDKNAAIVMMRSARKVFAATGWSGGVHHPQSSSNKSFGCGRGLNWNQPITEMMFEKQTWIMTRVPGRYLNFRRTAFISPERTSKSRPGRKCVFGLRKMNTEPNGVEKYHNIDFFYPQDEPGPDYNTKVHVVIEVRLDGESVGVPFGRSPTVGCFSDSHEATEIGMRIEWEDGKGNWCYKHLQSEYYNTFSKVDNKGNPIGVIPGATTGYKVATGLKAYLLRQDRPPTAAFPFLTYYGIAQIKELVFDHLTQTISMRPFTAKSNPTTLRRLRDDEIAKQLLDLGAETYAHRADANAAHSNKGDTGFPINPSVVSIAKWADRGGPARKSCDWCHSMVVKGGLSGNKVPCKEVGSTRRCQQCHDLGRPCTWTRSADLFANDALVSASCVLSKVDKSVKPLSARTVHIV